jgi:hypothetical protein
MASFDTVGASGISLSQYELNIYDGSGRFNAVLFDSTGNPILDAIGSIIGTISSSEGPDPGKMAWAWVLNVQWELYRLFVGISCWLYNLANSYAWLDWIIKPARQAANAFEHVIGETNVRPLALSIAGTICIIWIALGRYAKGLSQLFITFFIAALATGALAHPVDTLAGPGGALDKTHQFGLELSAALASGADDACTDAHATAQTLQRCSTGQLVDTFMRAPHQMVNYGANIDADGKCRAVYDEVLKQGLWGDDPTPRSRMGQCKIAYADHAYDIGANQAGTMAIVGFGGACLLILMSVLALMLLTASLTVVWEAARLPALLVKGMLPGGSRASLYQGTAQVAVALGVTLTAQVILSVFLLVLRALLVDSVQSGVDPIQTFFVIDLMIIGGVVMLVRHRSALRRNARHLADRLTAMGGSGPTRLPSQGHGLRTALGIAGTVASVRAARRFRTAASGGGGHSGRATASEDDESNSVVHRLQRRMQQSRSGRVALRTTKAAVATGSFALKSTVGAPVYAPRAFHAARQAATARRAGLMTKLRTKTTDAQAFATEYGHNMHVLARVTGVEAAGKAAARGARSAAGNAYVAVRGADAPATHAPRSPATISASAPAFRGAPPPRPPASAQSDPARTWVRVPVPPPPPATKANIERAAAEAEAQARRDTARAELRARMDAARARAATRAADTEQTGAELRRQAREWTAHAKKPGGSK